MAELEFIQFDGSDDPNKRKKKREAIRVHVMKNFHRQRRQEAAKREFSRACEAWDGWSQGTVGVTNTSSMANEDASQQVLRASIQPGHGARDQGALDLPNYPFLANLHADRSLLPAFHMHALIDQHVAHVESSSALLSSAPEPSPLSTDWLPASRAIPFLYHASVFISSASTETLAEKALSPSSYYHRGLAIKMINEQLSDPVRCASDETIAAIISLATFECIVGNITSLKYHVTGLLELSAMRGGLDRLGMNGLLRKLILIYIWFLEAFSDDNSTPIPPALLPPRPSSPSAVPMFHHIVTLQPSAPALPTAQVPLHSILKPTFAQPIVRSPECSSDRVSARLSALDHPSLSDGLPSNLEYIPRTCRLACLLYHAGPLRWPAAVISTRTHTLRDYLLASDMSTLWMPFPGVLLWCLVVGARSARGDDVLYSWFASQLMRCWVPLSMHRWDGLETALEWYGLLIRAQRKGESETVDGWEG